MPADSVRPNERYAYEMAQRVERVHKEAMEKVRQAKRRRQDSGRANEHKPARLPDGWSESNKEAAECVRRAKRCRVVIIRIKIWEEGVRLRLGARIGRLESSR
jgi:hypothetical protein